MNFDIIIVGSGPAGLFAARELENDFKVALIEKGPVIGRQGNRVVNKEVFKKLKVDGDCIINQIDNISFISPSGLRIDTKKESRGYVIDKEKMQMDIFSQLQDISSFMNSEVKAISLEKNELKTEKDSFRFKHLLASDGGNSFIRSRISTEAPIMVKCHYRIFNKTDEPTSCILSNKFAHGFYGWSIDMGETVEIGLGSIKEPFFYFRDFMKTYFPSTGSLIKKYGGAIPRSAIEKKVYGACVLIGDSAGGEPLMGSSIHKSIDEAKIASDLILRGEPLSLYETLWKERFSKVFRFEETARRRLDNITDREINEFFSKKRELRSDGLVTGLLKDLINQ